jgi:hypothetical protein
MGDTSRDAQVIAVINSRRQVRRVRARARHASRALARRIPWSDRAAQHMRPILLSTRKPVAMAAIRATLDAVRVDAQRAIDDLAPTAAVSKAAAVKIAAAITAIAAAGGK